MASKFKYLALVKRDYSSTDPAWKKKNKKIIALIEKRTLIFLGEQPQMPGHCICLDIKTGKPLVLHPEDIRVCTEEEV
jgi:hypothetical protein